MNMSHALFNALTPVPPQPPDTAWAFVDDLQRPRWTPRPWRRTEARPGDISLIRGVELAPGFPDPDGLLETAYADFSDCLKALAIPEGRGYRVDTGHAATPCFEAFRLDIGPGGCRIAAADTEGIRRGLFCLEDELLRAGGPFLTPGTIARQPWIKTRISRCFFGPIKRPPRMRDELLDDVDYYPNPYLARLAYEGINGLWLTVEFKDLCRTDIAPEYGADRDRRLAKLRRTIARCRRHGIKIYLFAIEPRAWPLDSPVLRRHPELGGVRSKDAAAFCPFSETARRYLRNCLHSLFADAPGLGGLITICLGERMTTCAGRGRPCRELCGRTGSAQPWAVIRETLTAMRAGMRDADPAAELIAWLYVPGESPGRDPADFDWIKDIAGHMPPDVVFQYNFESNGIAHQLGKPRLAGDYWLSYVGPSPVFRDCAARARAAGARVSAKLQVGCSHEVATAPYVPVPSSLYHKYAALRAGGASAVMMCWYFGNYPGLMNKAAGELAFEPFPASERDFLRRLAAIEWADRADDAARAYDWLWRGYRQYPVNCLMQYYGPMHDGLVWPLFLAPADAPLAPTWLLKMGFSGDRIGEAIAYAHTLDEVLELCAGMSRDWARGAALLNALAREFPDRPDRAREAGVAEALGLQFRSAVHIFRFYAHRERLLRGEAPAPLETLDAMRAIVRDERALDERLLALAAADSALGFHPEAEGYKYYPDKIRWRMRQLERLLRDDFPRVETLIRANQPLFPEYTGRAPAGPVAACPALACADPDSDAAWRAAPRQENRYLSVQHGRTFAPAPAGAPPWHAVWQVAHDGEALYLRARCPAGADRLARAACPGADLAPHTPVETLAIRIEPRRLWPAETFSIHPDGRVTYRAVGPIGGRRPAGGWTCRLGAQAPGGWSFLFRLPLRFFDGMVDLDHPIRLNVVHRWEIAVLGLVVCSSWTPPVCAATPRLAYGVSTPDELAWLHWAGSHPCMEPGRRATAREGREKKTE